MPLSCCKFTFLNQLFTTQQWGSGILFQWVHSQWSHMMGQQNHVASVHFRINCLSLFTSCTKSCIPSAATQWDWDISISSLHSWTSCLKTHWGSDISVPRVAFLMQLQSGTEIPEPAVYYNKWYFVPIVAFLFPNADTQYIYHVASLQFWTICLLQKIHCTIVAFLNHLNTQWDSNSTCNKFTYFNTIT